VLLLRAAPAAVALLGCVALAITSRRAMAAAARRVSLAEYN
jgi:hypothetical protein